MSTIEVNSATTSLESWAFSRGAKSFVTAVVASPTSTTSSGAEGFVVSDNNALRSHSNKRRTSVERKLRGFVVQFETETVRVLLFGPNNQKFEYRFPAKRLKEAGITSENQPFEFSETRIIDGDAPFYQIKFKPMAAASSGKSGVLELGQEYRQKLTKVLSYFGKKENRDASA